MALLRRHLPFAAALLAVLVAIQTTDVIACADEADAMEHADGSHMDGRAGDGHPAPASGDTHEDSHPEGTAADCLCHVVFTPTAIAPTVEVIRLPDTPRFGAAVAAPLEAEPLGLDHVPLG